MELTSRVVPPPAWRASCQERPNGGLRATAGNCSPASAQHRHHGLDIAGYGLVGAYRYLVGIYLDAKTGFVGETGEQGARAGGRVEHGSLGTENGREKFGGLWRAEVLLEADKGVFVAAGGGEDGPARG